MTAVRTRSATASGRWQARYQGPDGRQHTAPETFERKRDAEQFLAEVETDLARGDWFDPLAGRVSLSEHAAVWIEERDLTVRTAELYRGLLRNHIGPSLGAIDLADLTPPAIRRRRKHLRNNGVSVGVMAKAYRLLHAVLNTAVEDESIRTNPCNIKGGIRVERLLHPLRQVPGHHRLRDPVSDGRHPKTLVPPPPLGIGTALTSGGKYVPEDMRFQTLYKLFFRPFSNTSIDTPSTPDEPSFPLTFTQASHTSCLEMSNGLAEAFNSSIPLLPENLRLTEQTIHERPGPFAPPRLPRLPHYYKPVRQRAAQRHSAPDRSTSAPGSPSRPGR